jgi:fructose-1,6-bisphosphatase I
MSSTVAGTGQPLDHWCKTQGAAPAVVDLVDAIAGGCAEIATLLHAAPLRGLTGASAEVNIQGEVQKHLDIMTNDIMMRRLKPLAAVACLVSEEEDHVVPGQPNGRYCVAFDPLDGSSNIETNSTIGTVFSILDVGEGVADEAGVLAAYSKQVAAGYVLYGPAALMVINVGDDTTMLAFDPAGGDFEVVQSGIKVPADAAEFSINMSYQSVWHADTARYVSECLEGKAGPRGKSFNMRWAGAMVADVHRVFVRGGVFIYPAMNKKGSEEGKLRLLYEANPMAMLIEGAGGMAIANATPIRELKPNSIHQRVPLAMGSKNEVALLKEYAEGR